MLRIVIATKRWSYVLVFGTMILVGWFGMGTPFITVLFSYFVLDKLMVLKRKWLTVAVFATLVLVLGVVLGFFLDQAIKTLPQVAEKALPAITHYAEGKGLSLPFTDWESLRTTFLDSLKGQMRYLGNFAKIASKQVVFLLIGVVVAISLFLNPAFFTTRTNISRSNAYTVFCEETAVRFGLLYRSFATVMGAQLIISTINTGLTSLFIIFSHFPYAPLVLTLTFLCGLLPIVGNLLSNSLIVGVAFTVSPNLALGALAFLVTIHKLEYFLNSKIIGDRIQNPVWLTLIGLIVGERLMGITGMILAPVLLHYIKVEASRIEVCRPAPGGAGVEAGKPNP
jgi:predicted PurR-regulated permease PerM